MSMLSQMAVGTPGATTMMPFYAAPHMNASFAVPAQQQMYHSSDTAIPQSRILGQPQGKVKDSILATMKSIHQVISDQQYELRQLQAQYAVCEK